MKKRVRQTPLQHCFTGDTSEIYHSTEHVIEKTNPSPCKRKNKIVTEFSATKKGCWLVGCFGLNGPLRQYFSLYRSVSQREGERKEKL